MPTSKGGGLKFVYGVLVRVGRSGKVTFEFFGVDEKDRHWASV